MTQTPRRPLHRLTPLRDDPAAAWLTPSQRWRLTMTEWFVWSLLGLFSFVCWASALLVFRLGLVLTSVYCVMGLLAVIWPVRRMVWRRSSVTMAQLVRESTPTAAVAVDDFAELDHQPDGAIVSLVGWIRARGQLAEPVEGQPCIGLALACHQKYPGVLETLDDFELCDEAGRAVLVQVAGARMLGAANVDLTDGKARRLLIASLDLPTGAVATGWEAFVLRDGDPVMAVGFKQTALDPTQPTLRGPPARASVASLPPKPLLIFPLAAERRAPPVSPGS
jgi:hypothetical protein